MKSLKNGQIVLSVIVLALLTFLVLQISIPKASPRLEVTKVEKQEQVKEHIRFTALGDSLTEGVGDDTKKGGFVPLVANQLQEKLSVATVEIENFGVAGERSDQILKRIQKNLDIQKKIKHSDILTLTVGGNDLMKVIQSNFLGLSKKSFKKPLIKYQEHLTELLATMRELNPKAPIYVVGIYNPFYINFPEITEMQEVVDDWNAGTQAVVEAQDKMYFVPINEVISKGIKTDNQGTENSSTSESHGLEIVKNNVLYDEDKFHPNNLGYQLMAKEISAKITETKDIWLVKE
jgi:Lysophospholipase L1 and related esterases